MASMEEFLPSQNRSDKLPNQTDYYQNEWMHSVIPKAGWFEARAKNEALSRDRHSYDTTYFPLIFMGLGNTTGQ